MFHDRALLVPQYVVNEEIKKERYHDMIKDEIQEFVNMSSCKTLDDMIVTDEKQEIDLETARKRKLVQAQVLEGSAKKPNILDSRSRGQ